MMQSVAESVAACVTHYELSTLLQRVAVCCRVLQCVAGCCSVLQCVAESVVESVAENVAAATFSATLSTTATFSATLTHQELSTIRRLPGFLIRSRKIMLQRVAVCCRVLQSVAGCCSVLQCVAVCCRECCRMCHAL